MRSSVAATKVSKMTRPAVRPEKLERTSTRRDVRVSEMHVDPVTQRKLKRSWAQEIAENFDPDRLRVIVLSLRADGKYYIVDGQHRIEALRLMGYGDQLVDCDVFDRRGMVAEDVQREDAKLFLELSKTLAQKPLRAFQLAVVAEQAVECNIDRIVKALDLAVAPGSAPGSVSAISALRRVYAGAGTGRSNPDALHRTLQVILRAWGREASNFNGKIINGLGLVQVRYGANLDQDVLVKKLAAHPGGAAGLIGSAGTLYSIRHTDIAKCMASVIVDIYNKGRKEKLEGWWK